MHRVFNVSTKAPDGEVYTVPHKLQLSNDGVHAFFQCDGHPLGGGCVVRGSGTWETAELGGAVRVSLTLEVLDSAAAVAGGGGGGGGVGGGGSRTLGPEMFTGESFGLDIKPSEFGSLTADVDADGDLARGSGGGGAEAAAAAGGAGGGRQCTLLLRKQFRPLVDGWDDFKQVPSKFDAFVDRVDTLVRPSGPMAPAWDPLPPLHFPPLRYGVPCSPCWICPPTRPRCRSTTSPSRAGRTSRRGSAGWSECSARLRGRGWWRAGRTPRRCRWPTTTGSTWPGYPRSSTRRSR
eukprot:SAG22_NODE_833_length_6929_cov_27.036159_5_plen_292_part_00